MQTTETASIPPMIAGDAALFRRCTDYMTRWWARHAYIVPSFLLTVLICGWFCTWGSWRLFEPEEFCQFYDAQAISILDGRLDVPVTAIGTEAFVFRGKTYGYFGIGPALLRLPLAVAFDGMDGLWSRLMMTIASTTNLVCAYGILWLIRDDRGPPTRREKVLHSLFVICAGLGSTNIFLVARSFTFHEAIMWAGTFALLFTWVTLKYLARPSGALLGVAGCFAFMSFSSRPTVGAGALLAMCVLLLVLLWRAAGRRTGAGWLFELQSPSRPLRHATIAAVTAFVTIGVYLGMNYGKFRTFTAVPLQYYHYYKLMPARMQITGGKQIHLENIPTSVATYFGFRGVHLQPSFPWFDRSRDATFVGSPAIDMVDGFSTFPVSMPALTLLAVLGGFAVVRGRSEIERRLRFPVVALLIGGSIVLATVALCERYLHDFYPALIVLAAVGICRVGAGSTAGWKIAGLSVLALISIILNCSFALIHQRLTAGAPPEKVAEFQRWQRTIDNGLQSVLGARD
ncbi:MAG: hypothetical protein M3Z64_07400 [Verrucomicrobiota bacterium]|nr:hypothetical protein [Verrucomicrobiota bacterium]